MPYLPCFCLSRLYMARKLKYDYLQILLVGLQMKARKEFGSGQMIIEKWSGGQVGAFFEPQPKFSKSNECQHAEMATWRYQVLDVRCWADSLEGGGAT